MSVINTDIEEMVTNLLDSGVEPVRAFKIISYWYGGDTRDKLTLTVGKLTLNLNELDNVGITQKNFKLFRYICLMVDS